MILVTGASGLIGYRLCQALADRGERVTGIRYAHAVTERPGRHNVDTDICDITDYDDVATCVAYWKPDTVFHFAAHLPSTVNPDFIKVNVIGTSNLLAACHQNNVKNIIYASSMSVYSAIRLPVTEESPTKPLDLYGRTKLIGELLCECYSQVMRTITVRFTTVFGVGDQSRVSYHFMKAALSGSTILVDGDGSQSSDFIHVDDAVQGAILALEHGRTGEVYNIGSGVETSVLELAGLIANSNSTFTDIRMSGKQTTRPSRFVADISKARRELGYRPGELLTGLSTYREELLECTR